MTTGAGAPAGGPAPGSTARIARLDVLRTVAVALVMVRHLLTPGADHPLLRALVEFARMPAWLGVDLFFVLSGFLVSGLLFREVRRHGRVDATRFLLRRGFKIYPTYYLFVLATYALLDFPRAPGRLQLVQYAAFVQNYAAWQPGPWTHLWSLAVEEHFYLLLVVLFVWRFRPGRSSVRLREAVWGWCGIASVILLLRLLAVEPVMRPDGVLAVVRPFQFFETHFRLDALLFGVLLAYLYHERPEAWNRIASRPRALVAGATVALVPSCFVLAEHPFTNTIGFPLYYVAFGAILVATLGPHGASVAPRAWERPLAAIGVYSYSIYVWHVVARTLAHELVSTGLGWRDAWVAEAVSYAALSLVVGVVMARLVELPALAIRDRWFPSRSVERVAPA